MSINHQITDLLQLALELNIIVQRANEERKKENFTKYMELIVKEALRIQEFILINPTKEPPIKPVIHWLNNLLKIDEDFSKSSIGILLKEFSRKHNKELDN